MPRTLPVTFKLKKRLLDELDEIAKSIGVTRSELIRQAVTYYLLVRRRDR